MWIKLVLFLCRHHEAPSMGGSRGKQSFQEGLRTGKSFLSLLCSALWSFYACLNKTESFTRLVYIVPSTTTIFKLYTF